MGIQDNAWSRPEEAAWQQHAPVQRLSPRRCYFGTEREQSLGHLIKRLKSTSCHPEGPFSDHGRSRYNLIRHLELKSDDSRAKGLHQPRRHGPLAALTQVGSDLPQPAPPPSCSSGPAKPTCVWEMTERYF